MSVAGCYVCTQLKAQHLSTVKQENRMSCKHMRSNVQSQLLWGLVGLVGLSSPDAEMRRLVRPLDPGTQPSTKGFELLAPSELRP